MAEQLPTIGIHPGWYIAASVVSLIVLYALCGVAAVGYVGRQEARASTPSSESMVVFALVLWPFLIAFFVLYYPGLWAWRFGDWMARLSEPKDEPEKTK